MFTTFNVVKYQILCTKSMTTPWNMVKLF